MKLEIEFNVLFPGGGVAILKSLEKLLNFESRLMNEINEFAKNQISHFDRLEKSLAGISGDVTALNAKIAELQASADTLKPADRALLDDIATKSEMLATKFEAVDALNPPPPVDQLPVEPPQTA